MLTLIHNDNCSKSNCVREMITASGKQYSLRNYMQNPLSVQELKELFKKLKMAPKNVIRKGEPIYKEKYEGADFSDEQWIMILAQHPELLERPILVLDDVAIIGRPPEILAPYLQ